jgi:hypothetical protein
MFDTSTYDDPIVLDPAIRARWSFLETSSAAAVLRSVCPAEWADITHFLATFQLDTNQWFRAGGNRGDIAQQIDNGFEQRGWREMRLDLMTQGVLVSRGGQVVDRLPPVHQEGYLVDNFKGRVVIDVEWNAKDGNLDRDMSAYRSWHEAGVISAAVLITQDKTRLLQLAERIWQEYQGTLPEHLRNQRLPLDTTSTTTNLEKAALRVRRGVMGTCPLLVVAANPNTWNQRPYAPI